MLTASSHSGISDNPERTITVIGAVRGMKVRIFTAESRKSERTQLLGPEIEQLVVEAKHLGIELEEVLASVSAHWKRLSTNSDTDRGGRSKK